MRRSFRKKSARRGRRQAADSRLAWEAMWAAWWRVPSGRRWRAERVWFRRWGGRSSCDLGQQFEFGRISSAGRQQTSAKQWRVYFHKHGILLVPVSVRLESNQIIMLISLRDILILFEQVQKELNIAHVSVVLFCGLDIDSLCTLKILAKLFRSENVQYKVYPVAKYSQLEQSMAQAVTYQHVRLFIMVNCGAALDLTQKPIITRTQADIYLFDTHRPVNHANVQNPRVKVVDDGQGELDKCPTALQLQRLNEIAEYDIDSDSDYEEQELDEAGKRRRMIRQRARVQRQQLQRQVNSYYSHNFYSQPSSHAAYQLVRDLNKNANDYLWYAIVGTTSMFLEQKLSKEALDRLSQTYQSDAAKHNSGQGQGVSKERGDILPKKGFQFALLDHWSLYDSMLHSSYIFAKMGLWVERGHKKLHEFIHTLGISLQDAKQLYKYMPNEGQRKLDGSVFAAAEKHGLLDITYHSFARNVDHSAPFMASDFVHILTSTLEAPAIPAVPYAELPVHQIKCFWEAYDLLEGGQQQIGRKVDSSKASLRALMTEARNIMERGHILTINSISIANIRGDSQTRMLFQHPSALIRMAHLLMAITRQEKRSRPKPLIANWIAADSELCLSVGVSLDQKNVLGVRFNTVVTKMGIATQHDNFDANIIAFSKQHLSSFIREITRA